MKSILLNLYRDSLFRNSVYPMLATAVMAGLGFFFWLFSARLFTTEEVGLAAALISVMSMISTLALMGFDTATVRFLAHEERKNESMNTGILVISLASVILTTLFVAFVGIISPKLAFVREDTLTAFAFVTFTVMAAVNMFTDSIFLAHRETKYTFIIDTVFSLVKVALPFAFVPWGAFGIFAAAAVSQAVGFFMSIVVLVKRFSYRPQLRIDGEIVTRVWRYSAGNYVADFLNFLPLAVLPIIITNHLGPEQAAYYYIVMMIIGLLYVIPSSTMRSLFAEGSNDEDSIPTHVRGALKTTGMLLFPAIVVLLGTGHFILHLFGVEYSVSGSYFLYIMTAVSIFVASFTLFGSLFRLTHNIRALIVRNLAYALSTVVLVYTLLPLGLVGIGIAYAGGNLIGSVVSYFLFHSSARKMNEELSRRFTIKHFAVSLFHIFEEKVIWPFRTVLECREAYQAALKAGAQEATLFCYPERPRTYHTIYKLAHRLGWKITTDPRKHADVYMHFEDITERAEQSVLDELRKEHTVINADCRDISKTRVNDVFERVFGYNLSLDPQTHNGACVRKSDTNAVHDGKIIECPEVPKEGYVYQKLINTRCADGRVMDLRIPIFNDKIPFVLKRYKSTCDLFDKTIGAEFAETDDILSEDEKTKVITFCREMGLDYGEIDALRSVDDGKLYIVDVNNTPAGPIGALYENVSERERWYQELCNTMKAEFLK